MPRIFGRLLTDDARKKLLEVWAEVIGVDPNTVAADNVSVEFMASGQKAVVRWEGYKLVSTEEGTRLLNAGKTHISNSGPG